MSRAFSVPASIACALISLAYPAPGQTDIVLSGGLNFPSMNFEHDSPPWPLALDWNTGYSIGVSVETHLSRVISLVPSLEYAHYPWKDDWTPGWGPAYLSPVETGEPSRLYHMTLDARLYLFGGTSDGVFLSTGAGYVIEKLGRSSYSPAQHIEFVMDQSGMYRYPDRYYWIHTMGLGMHVLLSGNVGMEFTGEYFSNYTDRFHTSVHLGLSYRIVQ